MATTFTNLLRLAKQGTGDNPSTWGQIVNDQVIQLLEDSISGYLTLDVTGSSDITLTTGNGVADEARNAMIELTGFPIADISVIVPTITKHYILYGTYTGSNTVTVKTTSGTGVIVRPGDRKIVFCDGSNVIDVLPELGDLAYLDTITSVGLFGPGVFTASTIPYSNSISELTATNVNQAIDEVYADRVNYQPLNPRVQIVSTASSVTPVNTNDAVFVTSLASSLNIANPTGAWEEGQAFMLRIKDNGTARALTWGNLYRPIGLDLPDTTRAGAVQYYAIINNAAETLFDVTGFSEDWP